MFKGLEGFPANVLLKESKMVNFGGKLVMFGNDHSRFCKYDGKNWYEEIALERKAQKCISTRFISCFTKLVEMHFLVKPCLRD